MPGYLSTGHLPKNCPVDFSSNLIKQSSPFAINRNRQFQSGESRFQSDALLYYTKIHKTQTFEMKYDSHSPIGTIRYTWWNFINMNIRFH